MTFDFTVLPAPVRPVTATTPNGTAKTVAIPLLPGDKLFVQSKLAHGTVTVVGSRIIFTPAIGFVGTQVINYRIVHADGSIVLGTLSITVAAPLPLVTVATSTTLASTGSDSAALGWYGLTFIVAGAGAILLGRRRRSSE